MTLDEQIAWLEHEAREAKQFAAIAIGFPDAIAAEEEKAGVLAEVIESLRDYQRRSKPKMRTGDPVLVIFRPVGRPRKGVQPEQALGVYIKRVRTGGDALVEVGGELRRVKHANIRPAA
jgi:hypothetical protein